MSTPTPPNPPNDPTTDEVVTDDAASSDAAAAAAGKKKEPKKSRRRSPGYTARPHRVACEKACIRYKVRRQHPKWDDEAVETEVELRFLDLMPSDPLVRKQYEATAPVSTCPDRRDIFELVEVAAMRRLDLGQKFESKLRFCGDGRPSDRLVSTTIFQRNIWETGRPEVLRYLKELQCDYRLLHWAYDWPIERGEARHFTNTYKTMKAALDRWSDEECVYINLQAIQELQEFTGCEDIGRWVAIDGTDIPAPREQRQFDPDFPEEEEFLRGGLEDADFAYHGTDGFASKSWRGPRLIVLIDILTGLPLAWVVKKGSRPEYEALAELLSLTFRHWPEWTPEALVTDSHFDNERSHRVCEERFGIHLISGRAGTVDSTYDWADNGGTPKCSKHGDMRLVQSEGFVDVAARRKRGLEPGEVADLSKAAFRWECVGDVDDASAPPCPVGARTMWKTNPRLYTYFPRQGVHKTRVARRTALMLRRNSAESLNSALKGMGIGLKGQSVARWVSTDQQMRWLLGGTLLGFTLRRLAHETGVYKEVHAEAEAKGLLTASVPTAQDLEEVAERLKRRAAGADDASASAAA